MKHLIKELTWHSQNNQLTSKSPTHSYRITSANNKFKVIYCKLYDGYAREATGFNTLKEAKSWAYEHHCEKLSKWINTMESTNSVNISGKQVNTLLHTMVALLDKLGLDPANTSMAYYELQYSDNHIVNVSREVVLEELKKLNKELLVIAQLLNIDLT